MCKKKTNLICVVVVALMGTVVVAIVTRNVAKEEARGECVAEKMAVYSQKENLNELQSREALQENHFLQQTVAQADNLGISSMADARNQQQGDESSGFGNGEVNRLTGIHLRVAA